MYVYIQTKKSPDKRMKIKTFFFLNSNSDAKFW